MNIDLRVTLTPFQVQALREQRLSRFSEEPDEIQIREWARCIVLDAVKEVLEEHVDLMTNQPTPLTAGKEETK